MTSNPTIPMALGVASVHPDYLEACLAGCCTALKFPPKFEPGTVTLLRKTLGGGRQYGVVGIWWYTGEFSNIRAGDNRWSRRWSYLAQFKPLVLRFDEIFCESFTEPVLAPGAHLNLKRSAKIPKLVYTALQGSLIHIRDHTIAAGYLLALLKEKATDLQVEAQYRGEIVRVDRILSQLAVQFSKPTQADLPAKKGQ